MHVSLGEHIWLSFISASDEQLNGHPLLCPVFFFHGQNTEVSLISAMSGTA